MMGLVLTLDLSRVNVRGLEVQKDDCKLLWRLKNIQMAEEEFQLYISYRQRKLHPLRSFAVEILPFCVISEQFRNREALCRSDSQLKV